MSSLSISIALLPVLVPGLDEVHCPGPAVAAEDGELTSDEAHAWHHPATPAVRVICSELSQHISLSHFYYYSFNYFHR